MYDDLSTELAKEDDAKIVLVLIDAEENFDISTSGVCRQIIYADSNPERWAKICGEAISFFARHTQRSSLVHERLATLQLEEANGSRRMPGLWDIKEVKARLSQATEH